MFVGGDNVTGIPETDSLITVRMKEALIPDERVLIMVVFTYGPISNLWNILAYASSEMRFSEKGWDSLGRIEIEETGIGGVDCPWTCVRDASPRVGVADLPSAPSTSPVLNDFFSHPISAPTPSIASQLASIPVNEYV